MKKRVLCCTMLVAAFLSSQCKKVSPEPVTDLPASVPESVPVAHVLKVNVLQLNIWQEGTSVNGGFDGIVDVVLQSKADVVTLSEVRNYSNTKFNERIVAALKAKGSVFYSFYDNNVGILSRFPIASFTAGIHDGDFDKAILKIDPKVTIAVYSAHIDYTHYACYLPRGYDGTTFKKIKAPITDVNKVLEENLASTRDEAINAFMEDAVAEQKNGNIVILGGDFNEPSYLDWTTATKDLFDHHGTVIPWQNSLALKNKGYQDAYRVKYADPVKYPGFTWAAFNKDVALSKLVWAPDADERDRIDFIYYNDDKRMHLENITIVGPSGSIVRGKGFEDKSQADTFLEPNGIWPSDHKGVLANFSITVN